MEQNKDPESAADALDSQPTDPCKPSTWDAQIAAQASDEPMRAAFWRFIATLPTPMQDNISTSEARGESLTATAFASGYSAAQVSPRATADVERNLRAELINEGALRQYCHNDGSAGFVTAYDFDITNRFLAAIATTKPGA